MSWDRTPGVTQRAHDISQAHLTGESAAYLAKRKADAAEKLRRDRIKQEKERKRKEFEHHTHDQFGKDEPEDEDSIFDVVV